MGVGGEQSQCGENGWRNLLGSKLCVRVPLASQKKIEDVGVVPLGDNLFNRVAAVEESTRGTVDVADRSLGANDAGEARAEWLLCRRIRAPVARSLIRGVPRRPIQ
jgi:hypothetical protein